VCVGAEYAYYFYAIILCMQGAINNLITDVRNTATGIYSTGLCMHLSNLLRTFGGFGPIDAPGMCGSLYLMLAQG